MWPKLQRRARAYVRALTAVRTSNHQLALGFAVGTFISVLPTPGFNILLGFVAVAAYPRINKLSLFGAMAGAEPTVEFDVVIVNEVYNFTRRYLVGNLIVASLVSTASYAIVRGVTHFSRAKGPGSREAE
jgi:hypothetical protein